MGICLSKEEFEMVITAALQEIPEDLAQKIENVEVMVEDYPSTEIQKAMNVSVNGLLGLYTGVPKNHRSEVYTPLFPDHIILYQKNIEAVCRSQEELIEQIQRTVLHEVGHYFGIDDRRLRELGF